jgi:hypothetical protein
MKCSIDKEAASECAVDMVSTSKSLKLHHFDRALTVVGTEMRVMQCRGVRLVPGKLWDPKRWRSRREWFTKCSDLVPKSVL